MTKRINVRFPAYYKNYPLVGFNYELDTTQIYELIMVAKARIEEILDDGSTVVLTHLNYNKDNNPVVEEKEEKPLSRFEQDHLETFETVQPEAVVEEEHQEESVEEKEEPKVTTPISNKRRK